MPERAQGVGRVVVARTEVHLRADSLCSPRWVRYAVAVPEHVVAYRIGVGGGLPVTATPVEGDACEAAARTYLDEVSRALEELYRAPPGTTQAATAAASAPASDKRTGAAGVVGGATNIGRASPAQPASQRPRAARSEGRRCTPSGPSKP